MFDILSLKKQQQHIACMILIHRLLIITAQGGDEVLTGQRAHTAALLLPLLIHRTDVKPERSRRAEPEPTLPAFCLLKKNSSW